MDIIEYKNNKEEMESFKNDLKYWSNCCAELHHYGQYDIEESDLPKELLRAYQELWTDGHCSRCYLVEYKGAYGIALINEFDNDFASDSDLTMDELYIKMRYNAEKLHNISLFDNAQIVIAEYSGCDECHELIVILPADLNVEIFDQVADSVDEIVYKLDATA